MQLSKRLKDSGFQLARPCLNMALISISSVVLLAGCQSSNSLFGKVDNGSLAYLQATQLEPLQLPAEQNTAPFTPLYPLPNASPNTLNLVNNAGKRYELPPPYRKETSE